MDFESSSGQRLSTFSLVVGGNRTEIIEDESRISSGFLSGLADRSKIKLIKGENVGGRMWSKELIGLYW